MSVETKLPRAGRKGRAKSRKEGMSAVPVSAPGVPETVLLAVTGMSPAVLTETLWALAASGKAPVIPHRIVVITTLPGKGRIEEELFTPSADYGGCCVWDALRRQILGPGAAGDSRLILDDIRVIASRDTKLGRSFPLEDIRTPADNEVAADFILDEVRRITENPDTTLIASLAGGRKTMGALLCAALSLLGRPNDRLTHVLVNEPFEDPRLSPRFYFPLKSETLHQHPRTGGAHPGGAARLWLADVPFVRLRELFPKQIGRYPGSFNALVRACSRRIGEMSGQPEVAVDSDIPALRINGLPVPVSFRELALFTFLWERCRDGATAYHQQKEALDDFCRWLTAWGGRFGPFSRQREAAENWKVTDELDLRKQISSLRGKLERAGLKHLESFLLPRRGEFAIRVRTVG